MEPIVLRLDQRPWTSNWARSAKHWSDVARRTAAWRHAFEVLGLLHVGRALGPCEVIVTPYLADRRGQQDCAACAPCAKAAIDGLVDAGLWPDDTAEWITRVTFLPPVYGQGNALQLELRPAGWTIEVR
jgi:hypothetical protein